MIFALAIALSLQDPNLQKVVPVWTGQNGYEEYVKAAVILDRPESQALESYVHYRERPQDWTTPPQRPASIPENSDLLDVYRIEVKQLAPVLDLVRQGSSKSVRYPLAQITQATLMPEFSRFKNAALLFQHLAYLDFADGKNAQATQAILDGLEFSKRVRVSGLVALLVGIREEGFMNEAVQRHLGQLSLDDAQRIRKWVDAQTDNTKQVFDAAEMERKSYRATLDDYFANPRPYLADDIPPGTLARIQSFVKSASDEAKDEVYAYTLKRYEPYYAALAARAKRPESEWLTPIEFEDPEKYTAPVPKVGEDGAFAVLSLMAVVQNLSGSPNDALPAALEKAFIKERLLGATCDVVQYRWINGKLPQKLEDACSKGIDPATGESYVYQTMPDGSFKLICHATALGDITLTSTSSTEGGSKPPRSRP